MFWLGYAVETNGAVLEGATSRVTDLLLQHIEHGAQHAGLADLVCCARNCLVPAVQQRAFESNAPARDLFLLPSAPDVRGNSVKCLDVCHKPRSC